MNNKIEIKINLVDGSFHFYDIEEGFTFDLTDEQCPNQIVELLNRRNYKVPKFDLESVPIDQMSRYLDFAKSANNYLELLRMRLKGQYTQVYLWGHNFDFDLVWFTGFMSSESPEMDQSQEQLDIGVSPGDGGHPKPYLYVTPRPFNDSLLNLKLLIGKWVTENWKGIQVEWADLQVKPHNEIIEIIEKLYYIGKKNFEI